MASRMGPQPESLRPRHVPYVPRASYESLRILVVGPHCAPICARVVGLSLRMSPNDPGTQLYRMLLAMPRLTVN